MRERLGLEVISLPLSMIVITATNRNLEANWVCEDCITTVKDQIFSIYLIYLTFKKIYVVLAMDWLSNNSIYISCKDKIIFIPPTIMSQGVEEKKCGRSLSLS